MDTRPKVLIVDDDAIIRRFVTGVLSADYEVVEVADSLDAIEQVRRHEPDVVLLDIVMPGIDGHALCRKIKEMRPGMPPQVVMTTARSTRDDMAGAIAAGADDYVTKPIDAVDLRVRVGLQLRLRSSLQESAELRSEIAGYNSEFDTSAFTQLEKVVAIQDVTMLALAKVAESRDNETGAHILRMRDYSVRLAEELRRIDGPHRDVIDDEFLADLYRSAPLHDIGKVGIPDSILLKPGRLSPDEMEQMKRHAMIGANILHQVVVHSKVAGFLSMAALIARFHHEKWNGEGYPAGLTGVEIPLPARIVAVADVYDALTSERPYKKAFSPERAGEIILNDSGEHFDPVVVQAFERCSEDFIAIMHEHADTENVAYGAACFAEYMI